MLRSRAIPRTNLLSWAASRHTATAFWQGPAPGIHWSQNPFSSLRFGWGRGFLKCTILTAEAAKGELQLQTKFGNEGFEWALAIQYRECSLRGEPCMERYGTERRRVPLGSPGRRRRRGPAQTSLLALARSNRSGAVASLLQRGKSPAESRRQVSPKQSLGAAGRGTI